jgi:hypothetical protein
MSFMGAASSKTAGGGPPPTPPFGGGVNVQGDGPAPASFRALSVSSSSGTVSVPYFSYGTINGTEPITQSLTIISNGGGKLGLDTLSGGQSRVTYSGMAVFENQTIVVQFDAHDAVGASVSQQASIKITRAS